LKLLSFKEEQPRVGALVGGMVLDLNSARDFIPTTLSEILARGLLATVQNIVDNASDLGREHLRDIKSLSIYPPVLKPGKIICVGLNYKSHAEEQDRQAPERPIIFAKAPSALAGPFDDVVVPAGVTHIDAEAELAVVIGRECKAVEEEDAMDYVAGFMALNDVTARKFQKDDGQWFRSKSFDTFAPCGPWLVTKDEIGDWQNLNVQQRLNGKTMQDGNTSEMIFPVAKLVSYISKGITLLPGDIISTGTPAGVGVFRNPRVFLEDGDVVEVEIARIGKIRNRVRIMQAEQK